jgi:hypothetical protein
VNNLSGPDGWWQFVWRGKGQSPCGGAEVEGVRGRNLVGDGELCADVEFELSAGVKQELYRRRGIKRERKT